MVGGINSLVSLAHHAWEQGIDAHDVRHVMEQVFQFMGEQFTTFDELEEEVDLGNGVFYAQTFDETVSQAQDMYMAALNALADSRLTRLDVLSLQVSLERLWERARSDVPHSFRKPLTKAIYDMDLNEAMVSQSTQRSSVHKFCPEVLTEVL
jgi:hypothetical protein